MKKTYLSILLLVLILLTSCGPSFEAELNEGSDMITEGKIHEAEEFFLELMEKHNDRNELNLKLGQIYLSTSDLDNAKKYLMNIEEESSDLAISLLKLANDSKDLDLLDKTFNKYKDMDIVSKSNRFFENSILAYSKFNKGEKIEESINKALELNLKLDPEVIVRAYNALLELNMKDLADSIIEKDVYNKNIGDLSIISGMIKEEDNRDFINFTSGYFVSPDRLDIALLYGIDNEGHYPRLEIDLVNGLNGEIISTFKEESINVYMKLGTFDVSGHNDHILSLWSYAGGSGTPPQISLYRFESTNLQPVDFKVETDMDIIFKDDFEYEIKSEKLDKSYICQLDIEEVPYYISKGFYDRDGKYLYPQEGFGIGYEPMSVVSNLGAGDYILYSLGLWDTIDNKSNLGTIESYFRLEGDSLVITELFVEDREGNPMAFNYKDSEGYKEVDFNQFIPKEEDIKEILSFHLSLFEETENTIRTKYGVPKREDYYGVKYLQYDDFLAFVNPSDANEAVSSVWTTDLLGMENNQEFIIQKFGPPIYSGYDEEEMETFMEYHIDNYYIDFIDIGGEYPFIKIKPY